MLGLAHEVRMREFIMKALKDCEVRREWLGAKANHNTKVTVECGMLLCSTCPQFKWAVFYHAML
jgi:hypothetical protein